MSAACIRELNDAFRQSFRGGRVMLTASVAAWSVERQAQIIALVRGFRGFTDDSDPYHEHDFGAFEYEGIKHFWKIDYYDPTGEAGSEDPSSAEATLRVLTIMQADEY